MRLLLLPGGREGSGARLSQGAAEGTGKARDEQRFSLGTGLQMEREERGAGGEPRTGGAGTVPTIGGSAIFASKTLPAALRRWLEHRSIFKRLAWRNRAAVRVLRGTGGVLFIQGTGSDGF